MLGFYPHTSGLVAPEELNDDSPPEHVTPLPPTRCFALGCVLVVSEFDGVTPNPRMGDVGDVTHQAHTLTVPVKPSTRLRAWSIFSF